MAGKWRGNGKGAGKGKSSPQILELQFHERANNLFEQLMNWNATPPQLDWSWKEVVDLRGRCMAAYGGGGGGGGAAAGGAVRGGVNSGPDGGPNWKQEFHMEFARANKTAPTKEDVSYEVAELEGPKPGVKQYSATINCTAFTQAYEGEMAISKRLAEHNAAKAAMEAEWPACFARVNSSHARGGAPVAPAQKGKGGQKRNAAAALQQPEEPKQRLAQSAQILTEGEPKKGDIVYETVETGGQYTATVTLQKYDPSVGYQGLPADTKKAAETAAAEAALQALAGPIGAADEIHQAKKRAKKQESLASFRDKQASKKEVGLQA